MGSRYLNTEVPTKYLNMHCEMQLGMKTDYRIFQISRLLQATEIQLLQNQCQQEPTQILTNLTVALMNPRLLG